MPLEDLVGPNKFIDDLVKEWPLGIDPFSEGDDHIRGVKNVLGNSFPTVAEARYPVSFEPGPAGAATEEKNGAIEMSSGTTAQRPSSPSLGAVRYNTDTGYIEQWTGLAWANKFAITDRDNLYKQIDDGAAPGPLETLDRERTTPAVDDVLGQYVLSGNGVGYGSIEGQIVAVGQDGRIVIKTRQAGALAEAVLLGAGLYLPGATDLGKGWVNAYEGVARRGVEYARGWTYETKQAASGAAITFANLLETASEFSLALEDVTNSNTGHDLQVRIGNGTVVATGYESNKSVTTGTTSNNQNTNTSIGARRLQNAGALHVTFRGELMDPTTNLWHVTHQGGRAGFSASKFGHGQIALGAGNPMNILELSLDGASTYTGGTVHLRLR